MRKKGSVTVFLTLILSLLLSLICASIESVRMASARTQILNGMDIGLYSLFGQYDKELLTDYDLFALDGSRGGGQLDLAAVCDELEAYMNPVLKQNSQKLTLCQSGLTGSAADRSEGRSILSADCRIYAGNTGKSGDTAPPWQNVRKTGKNSSGRSVCKSGTIKRVY